MFFKKRETEIDDDFDDNDDFDDFDLDDGGFDDTTPKSGPRKAVATITGGFFSGLKSSLLDPSVHRKVLKESFPDGYVAHYDDAKDTLREAKSIYDTAADEVRKLKVEYSKEVQPSVDMWNNKTNSKFSNKVAKIVGSPVKDDGGNEISPQDQAFTNSANEVFGNSMAQATSDGISNLNQQTQAGNTIQQGLQSQTNTILTNVSNTLNNQNAFNEQVALKWKKKTLEIQFKQYFTARKQLDIQTQSFEYLKASLPNIVKNTGLPDLVKTQTSEIAGQMLTQKWIGALTDKAHTSIGDMIGKAGGNIKTAMIDKAQSIAGNSSMVGSALGMFNNDSGFGQSPQDMALEMLGGVIASSGVDWAVGKGTTGLKNKIDASSTDFGKHSESLTQLKQQMPAILASLGRNGTGVDVLDKLMSIAGLDEMGSARSTVVQSSMGGDNLAAAAMFDLETKKSITYTIPTLLSEIHGELSSVRFAVGGDEPNTDNKLRMDWTSGQLNTNKRIARNLEDKMYTRDKADSTSRIVYKMLGELGFDEKQIEEDRQVEDKDGNILLTPKDLNYLSVAVKTAAYDSTKFFEIEDLAQGSLLIRDENSRMNIAKFFTEQLEVEGSADSLDGVFDIVGTKRSRLENLNAKKIKQQNIIDAARIEASREGIDEKQIADAIREGKVNDLMSQGILSVDKDGNYTLDAQAHAERLMLSGKEEARSVKDMFNLDVNNEYGADERNIQRLERVRIQQAKEAEEKRIKDEEKEAERERKRNRTGSKFSHLAEDLGEGFQSAKSGVSNARTQLKDFTNAVIPQQVDDAGNPIARKTVSELIAERANEKKQQLKNSLEVDRLSIPEIIEAAKSRSKKKQEEAEEVGESASNRITEILTDNVSKFIESMEKGVERAGGKLAPVTRPNLPLGMDGFNPDALSSLEPVGGLKDATFRRSYREGEKPEVNPVNATRKYIKLKTVHLGAKLKEKEKKEPRRIKLPVRPAPERPEPELLEGSSFTESQAQEVVVASSLVVQKMIGDLTNPDDDSNSDKSNFFTGGTVGRFSSLIKNFDSGGSIGYNKIYNRMIDKWFKDMPTDGAKPKGINRLLNPIKQAMDKETKAGGDAQLIVASSGEEVLSKNNGDAQAFRNLQRNGTWEQLKEQNKLNPNSQMFSPAKSNLFDPHLPSEESKSMTDAILNVASEIKKLGLDSTAGIRADIKGAYADLKGNDDFVGPTKPSVLANGKTKANQIKDSGIDKLKSLSEKVSGFDGFEGDISLPSFSMEGRGQALSTMSHQLAELIRITGHVAINTGSTADDLTPADASLITPFNGKSRLASASGNFFTSLKGRFKRKEKEEGDEIKVSRWDRLKSKFSRGNDDPLNEVLGDEEIDESTPEGKKKGITRRLLGGMFGLSWGTTKAVAKGSFWATKKSAASALWATKKTAGVAKWGANGLFGSTEDTKDVYLEGRRKPVMLARDIAEGKYISAEDGSVINTPEDIVGAVLDLNGNFIITEEDYNNRLVVVKTKEGTQSIFVRAVKGTASISSSIMGGSFKMAFGLAKIPFKIAAIKVNKKVEVTETGEIDKDIYVVGDKTPRILASKIGRGEYFDSELDPLLTYNQLAKGVYDKDANMILSPEDVDKGLRTPDGTLISNVIRSGVNLVGGIIKGGLKVAGGLFSLSGKILGAGFNLATGAGKGLWNSLRGNAKDFDIDGVDKYALMLQAQAAGVDKLEMIRQIIDERMDKPEGAFDDKDKSGHRDGSYMDQLREKIAKRKEKEEEKKRKKKEKSDKDGEESPFKDLASQVTQGIAGFFSSRLLFAAVGGLVAANFGPQIASGVFSGIRSLLPRWMGGYSKEKKDEIEANGGIMQHMMASGKAAGGTSDVPTEPQVDENGNPLPPQTDAEGNPVAAEKSGGMSTGTKFAIGAAATLYAPKIIGGLAKGAMKVPGIAATGIRLASNATGMTARMGLSGLGKRAAAGKMLRAGGGLLKGAGRLAVNPVARAAAGTALRSALGALPALAASPVGLAVLGVVAVGALIYGGYKLYKYLTRADNHLTTFRMAQYGYKIGDKNEVTKILNLEQYLGNYTVKASASSSAKILKQADTKEVLKIFGINESNKAEVDKFFEWYYYRFKPVFLSWKTLFSRATGKTDLGEIDKVLYMEDKLKMIDDANFNRAERNPYDSPASPMPSVDILSLEHEDVIEIKDKVIKELGKIDIEKHDEKARSSGAKRRNADGSNTPAIDKMTASPVSQESNKMKQDKESRKQELENNRSRLAAEREENKELKKKQGWFSKFMFGDREKAKEDPSMFSTGNQWGAAANKKIRSWFGGGDGGEGGTYDASNKTLNLSEQDIIDITKVTSTEVAAHLKGDVYNKQAGAIVDTIINRVVSKGYPDTVRGVINQSHQFSQISGNKGAYGSVQNMPDGKVNGLARAFVPNYLRGRVDGSIKPVINGDLNYLNPHHSGQKAMRTWGKIIKEQAEKSGQIYGTGKSVHYHGTSTEMLNKKPFGFKLAMGGKTSQAQGQSKTKTAGASNGIMGTSAASMTRSKSAAPTSTPSSSSGTKTTKAGNGPIPYAPGKAGATTFNDAFDKANKAYKLPAGQGVMTPKATGTPKVNMSMSGVMAGKPALTNISTVAAPSKLDTGESKNGGKKLSADSPPAKAAAYATRRARSGSTGYCAQYVRLALENGGGYKSPPTPRESAYMYVSNNLLVKIGFTEISASATPQVGDVAVIMGNAKSKHGHICIYNGKLWVSDFKHPQPNVYGSTPVTVKHFRDSRYLNGVSTTFNVDNGSDGSFADSFDNAAAASGPPRYKMKLEDTLAKLQAKREKREALLAKKVASNYKSKEVKIGFSGGRGAADAKASKQDTGKSDYVMGMPKHKMNLPKTDVIPYDTTPTGYIPKERISTVVKEDETGLIGNSVKTKRDAETIRLEHAKGEADRLAMATNAQKIREAAEKQNQEQLKRVEKARSAEITTATEQKVILEKQQAISEADSTIYKQMLDVQISTARDIRRMAETLDKIYASPTPVLINPNAGQVSKDNKPTTPAEMNRHTTTVAANEPVSMKIR